MRRLPIRLVDATEIPDGPLAVAAGEVVAGQAGGGTGLPPGGTTGQVLKKASDADGDVSWQADLQGSGGSGGAAVLTDWHNTTGSISSSAYSWKGNLFRPGQDIDLYALGFLGNLVVGHVMQAAMVTISGTLSAPGTVATVTKSEQVTVPATRGGRLWLRFASPVRLTTGTVYGLLVGRTDADGYTLPIPFTGAINPANVVPMPGYSEGYYARCVPGNLQVGTALEGAGSSPVPAGMGYQYALV